MLRWCSYCQKFLGEKEPYHSFDVTHGVCAICREKAINGMSDDVVAIRNFFSDLFRKVEKLKAISPRELISESDKLGISRPDLLVGILQPMLEKIGDAFENKEIDVLNEHLFSNCTESILAHFQGETPLNEEVVLACVDGNYHSIGIKMMAALLEGVEINPKVIAPGLPAREFGKIFENSSIKVLGLSAYMESQLKEVAKIVELRDRYSPSTEILLGGHVVKTHGFVSPKGIDFVADPHCVRKALSKIKELLLAE